MDLYGIWNCCLQLTMYYLGPLLFDLATRHCTTQGRGSSCISFIQQWEVSGVSPTSQVARSSLTEFNMAAESKLSLYCLVSVSWGSCLSLFFCGPSPLNMEGSGVILKNTELKTKHWLEIESKWQHRLIWDCYKAIQMTALGTGSVGKALTERTRRPEIRAPGPPWKSQAQQCVTVTPKSQGHRWQRQAVSMIWLVLSSVWGFVSKKQNRKWQRRTPNVNL